MEISIDTSTPAMRGAEGEVYLATDELDQKLAVKFLYSHQDDARKQAIRRAKALSLIDHPNVVRIFGYFELTNPAMPNEEKMPAMVLQRIDGKSLSDWLAKKPPKFAVLEILLQIVDGLDAFHSNGTPHGDIESRNILVTPKGAKLIDPAASSPAPDSRLSALIRPDIEQFCKIGIQALFSFEDSENLLGILSDPSRIPNLGYIRKELIAFRGEKSNYHASNLGAAGIVPNPEFVGRQEYLDQLKETLGNTSVIITGEGGIGKTQLVVAFLTRNLPAFDRIWWLRASANEIQKDLTDLCDAWKLPYAQNDPTEKLIELLRASATSTSTMLILDDLDDPKILNHFKLPSNSRIIGTSKRTDFPSIYTQIRLEPLSDTHASMLLTRHRKDLERDQDLIRVVNHLGNHPLALALAASYLRKHAALSLEEFLSRMRQAEIGSDVDIFADLDPESILGTGYKRKVAQALSLNFSDLSPDVRKVLNCIAFCAPFGIPLRLVKQFSAELSLDLNQTSERLAALAMHSIISFGRTVGIHALTQSAVRSRLTNDEFDSYANLISTAIYQEYVRDPQNGFEIHNHMIGLTICAHKVNGSTALGRVAEGVSILYRRRSAYHFAIWAAEIAKRNSTLTDEENRTQLCRAYLYSFANYCTLCAFPQATLELKMVTEILNNYPLEELRKLTPHLNFHWGELYFAQGKHREALRAFETAISELKEIGDQNSDTYTAWTRSMVECLIELEEYDRASDAIREISTIDFRFGRLDNGSKNDVIKGSLANHRGKYDEALVYLKSALEEIESNKSSAWNELYALILTNIGFAYMGRAGLRKQRGDFEIAKKYHERSLTWRKDRREPEGINFAICLNNLGGAAMGLGKPSEAVDYYSKAEAIDRRNLGMHSNLGRTLWNKGLAQMELGQSEAAYIDLIQAFVIYHETEGPNSRKTKLLAEYLYQKFQVDPMAELQPTLKKMQGEN